MMRLALLVLAAFNVSAVVSCYRQEMPGRSSYERGMDALVNEKFEAANDSFLAALDEARGTDDNLLFHARYQLATSYAKQAQSLETEDLDKAISLLSSSASLFRKAHELRKSSDAKMQLRRVIKKQLLLQAQKQGNKELIEKIAEMSKLQRAMREQLYKVVLAGANGQVSEQSLDEVAKQLGSQQRLIAAKTGEVWDFGRQQKAAVEQSEEGDESERQVRLHMLTAALQHLELARETMWEHRRHLRAREAELALESSSRVVSALELAREALTSPLERVRLLAAEQQTVMAELAVVRQADLAKQAASGVVSTEQSIADRTKSLHDMFTSLPPLDDSQKSSPAAALARKQVEWATPHLGSAHTAMSAAVSNLESKRFNDATQNQQIALIELGAALEKLADLATLIEVTEQSHKATMESLALSTSDRKAELESIGETVDRLERMIDLIRVEKLAAQEKAKEQGQDPAQTGAVFDQAEVLRTQGEQQARQLQELLSSGKRAQSFTVATELAETLQELKLLFANIVEHLKVLRTQQSELRDNVLMNLDSDNSLAASMAAKQQEFSTRGEGLASALEQMAQNPQMQPEMQDAYNGAASEVRLGTADMLDAHTGLADIAKAAGQMSMPSKPIVDSQGEAVERLEAAIALLTPPEQQNQKQDQQKQQGQDQDKQKKQGQDNQPQGGDKGQKQQTANRDVLRDQAERLKKRQKAPSGAPMPPEKDW